MSEGINIDKVNESIKKIFIDYPYLKTYKLTGVYIHSTTTSLHIKVEVKDIIFLCCLLPFKKIKDTAFWFLPQNEVTVVASYE